jgi:EF-P beta-lysylation protein EpmB
MDLPRRPKSWPGFSAAAAQEFHLRLTPAWLNKIENSDQPGALIRQVLPSAEELLPAPGFERDPFDEAPANNRGLLRKYAGRLLVMATWACSGHCRFCFRRNLLSEPVKQSEVQAAFRRYMETHGGISEVILSGGDPFTLNDARLESWFRLIASYPQIRRLRIHSREPVFSPERITPALGAIIQGSQIPVVIAIHVNHADELDGPTREAISILRQSGALLLTQTVLLKGVNDSVEALTALFERAVDSGLAPYYLHQLDRVSGAAHFEVERTRGLELVAALQKNLPGYLVPRYVEEVPGAASKLAVSAESAAATSA